MSGAVYVQILILSVFLLLCSETYAFSYRNTTRIRRQTDCGFKCKSDGKCIEAVRECNGVEDCADGSDETEACKGTWCPKYLFRCDYGACISRVSVCDGKQDCKDNSDETGPNCKRSEEDKKCGEQQFQCKSGECIDPIYQCNGKADCRDKSDETEECKNLWCQSFLYRCDYGACVNGDAECNGFVDCLDGSDEAPSKCGHTTLSPTKITTTEAPPTPFTTPSTTTSVPVTPGSSTGDCILPDFQENGRWKLLNGNGYPGMKAASGTVITGLCDNGHTLESETTFSICFQGVWTISFVCHLQCPAYKSTSTTTITCSYNDLPRDCGKAITGTYMNISCATFYENTSSGNLRYCKDGTWDNAKPRCQPACGMKRVRTQTLSVGGTKVDKGDYPWQVAIFKNINGGFQPICGGSMLSTKVVLTAAHCMVDENPDGTISLAPKNFEVAVGKYYRGYRDPEDKDAQYTKIKEIIPAEEYRGSFGNYLGDIALLVVDIEFKLSTRVQPVCRDNSDIIHLQPGQIGIVTGWGFTKHGGDPSNELQEIKVPYEEDSICRSKLPDLYVRRYYSYDKMCAGYYNSSKAVCEGDSGGALVFDQRDGKFYVRGIVSISPRVDGSCDIQQYTLYTNVNKFNRFIDKTIIKYT